MKSTPNPATRILVPALVVLASLLVTLIVLEIGTRLYYSRHLDYQIEMSRYAALLKRDAPSPDIGHEHLPMGHARLMGVDVQISEAGDRDRSYPLEKGSDTTRILLLGDSLTFGWGVRAEARFSDILEERLGAALAARFPGRRLELINTGIGNFNTSQQAAVYRERGRALRPDIVVVAYFINDAEPTPRERAPGILRRSYLGMLLWGRLDILARRFGGESTYETYYTDLYREDAPGWRETRSAMARLAGWAREDGFELILFILPELHVVGPVYGFAAVHEQVIRAAHEAGIESVVDLAPAFSSETPRDLWVSVDDAHPNERAHRILADAMYPELISLVE